MFNKPSTAVNVLTAIAAVLLSILLVVTLPLVSLYGVAVSSVSPAAIGTMTRTAVDSMVESADFEQMILENEAVQQNITELGISADVVGKLMQSDAADEVIGMLATDMSNLLTDPDAPVTTTPDALVAVIKEHADELAQIAVEMTGETDKKEQLKAEIIAAVEKDADGFVTVLPNMEEMRQTLSAEMPLQEVSRMLNTTILWGGIGICLLLAGLIYLCRFHRFGGFLWLGVDGVLAAGILGIAAYVLRLVGNTALATAPAGTAGVLGGIVGHTMHALNVRTWIVLGIAVACIAAFILLYVLVVKKKDATPAAVHTEEAAPAVTTEE